MFEAVIARIAARWHQRIDWQSIGDRAPAEWLTRFGTAALTWILEEEALFVGRMGSLLPGIDDGVRGMALIEAAVRASREDAGWVAFP